jgi:hypothetical protein
MPEGKQKKAGSKSLSFCQLIADKPDFYRTSGCISRALQGMYKPFWVLRISIEHLLTLYWSRKEFERNRRLDKRDFSAIEYLLRKGQRQLEIYASPGIKDIR